MHLDFYIIYSKIEIILLFASLSKTDKNGGGGWMKRKRLLLSFGIVMLCLSLFGCSSGPGGGGGSGTKIRGQVLINGQPARSNQVDHYIVANGKTYFDLPGKSISDNGYFSHSDIGLDSEFCYPGCVISLVFTANAETAPGAFGETRIDNYIVKAGDNNFGTIDIGLHGFALVSPDDEAEVGPDPWPPQFQWSAYQRAGITPEYKLSLGRWYEFLGAMIYNKLFEKTTQDTSVSLAGDENFAELDLDNINGWRVQVEYEEKGCTLQHVSETRKITLVPPEE